MIDTLKLWKILWILNIKRLAIYRVDFILGLLAMAMSSITSVLFFWVIFQSIPTLNGWTFNEILFLSGLTGTAFGLWHTFLLGPAFWNLEHLIRSGDFDRYMIRPVSALKYLLLSHFDDDGMGELAVGLVVLFYSSSQLGIVWTFQSLALLFIFIISSTVIIFSIFLSFSTITFWIVRAHAIGDVIFELLNFSKYPLSIFNPIMIFFLTFFIPIGFTGYYPSQVLLGMEPLASLGTLSPLVAIVSLIIALKFWSFGLNNYTSTGS